MDYSKMYNNTMESVLKIEAILSSLEKSADSLTENQRTWVLYTALDIARGAVGEFRNIETDE